MWTLQYQDTTYTGELSAVHFATATAGTTVGKDIIFTTSDGGVTWTQLRPASEELKAIAFADANTGTIVGSLTTIVRMSK